MSYALAVFELFEAMVHLFESWALVIHPTLLMVQTVRFQT